MTLTYKDDHKDNYKEIFEEPDKEIFDEIKQNDLIYYFKSNTTRKRFIISILVYNFLEKQSDEIEQAKNCRMYLNQI